MCAVKKPKMTAADPVPVRQAAQVPDQAAIQARNAIRDKRKFGMAAAILGGSLGSLVPARTAKSGLLGQ